MLRKVKDEVAWTKADASIVKELLESEAEWQDTSRSQSQISQKSNSIDDLASAISENKVAMSKLGGIKPWFALNPPKERVQEKD